MNIIIGGGLAGLSCSYHLGHDSWNILEQHAYAYGHASSQRIEGFTWDQGPHVSFTKHQYVRELFERAVRGEFEEFPARVSNYFRGAWIDHPAQTSLHQVPEPLRSACLESFLKSREHAGKMEPSNYAQWLEFAFGQTFAQTFPAAYTRKYWTVEPEAMTTDWVGGRVLKPDVESVLAGARGPQSNSLHYINTVRYPRAGGYQSFASSMSSRARIRFGAQVSRINLAQRQIRLANGETLNYRALINTMPLPDFINACVDVPTSVQEATDALSCTQVLLVNIGVPCTSQRPEHWIYVYDEDKLATRLSFTDKLARGNAPGPGWTGVQTEVYFSRHKPLALTPEEAKERVLEELIEMEVLPIQARNYVRSGRGSISTVIAPWANVIYLHDTCSALETIWHWLEQFGLIREADDTHPLTDWETIKHPSKRSTNGTIRMSGRFGQWKYYWSDDCVMRGRQLGQAAGMPEPTV